MSVVRKWAPIALFAYNRADHLCRTVEALARNEGAGESDLHIFSDGPRNKAAAGRVAEVRAWLSRIVGFKSVQVVERDRNLGLAKSIISGVTELLARHERLIVLEDDMITSPFFLRYMNEALELYAGADEVASVHGYVYPVQEQLPETFFLRGADCWGWATWRRAWPTFEPDGGKLLAKLERRGLGHEFDFHGNASYMRMLRNQIIGLNDSWAVRWYASAFLAGKLTLYPGRSLVQNIGNDGSGSHCGSTDLLDAELAVAPLRVAELPLIECPAARSAFARYFRRTSGWRARLTKLRGSLRVLLSGSSRT